MRSRLLVLGAAVWAAGYLVVYLVLVRGQGGPPAWWYVALLVVAVALLLTAASGGRIRAGLMLGVLLLAVASVVAMLSIGVYLMPAVAAAAVAATRWPASAVNQGS